MTTGAQFRVQRLSKGDWPLLQDARLRALKDSPEAFLTRYDDVASWDESHWTSELDAATWLVASDHQSAVGLIRSTRVRAVPASYVESAWVDERYRRLGVLSSLLHKLVDLERRAGVRDLLLWVFEDNTAAQLAYRRVGFVGTGKRQRADGDGRYEQQFRLAIA